MCGLRMVLASSGGHALLCSSGGSVTEVILEANMAVRSSGIPVSTTAKYRTTHILVRL